MQKENKSFKNIIILLVVVIVLLIGFGIILIIELHDEKEDIEKLSPNPSYNSSTYPNNNHHYDDEEHLNTDNQNYITKEEALNIALNHAKLSSKDIYDVGVELDYKYNQTVYEIDFKYQQYEYEYYINAENSSIIKSFREIDY